MHAVFLQRFLTCPGQARTTLLLPMECAGAAVIHVKGWLSFECRINKLTVVFHASVLLLIMNFVIIIADYFDNVMTKFIVFNRTYA